MKKANNRLCIIVPCYNEQEVLPITVPLFANVLTDFCQKGKIAKDSKLMLVDDGSNDSTWSLITEYSQKYPCLYGIRQSHNRGHQNALKAGLLEARGKFDMAVTLDADGQDDVHAIEKMVDAYLAGSDIVYGVRSSRKKDSFLKRATAQSFYRFMKTMGVETVYNHADFRLISARVLEAFSQYTESNLFLRALFPSMGFNHSVVYYERDERQAGKSKYGIRKMLHLAVTGITGYSLKPLYAIFPIGLILLMAGIALLIWQLIASSAGNASMLAAVVLVACLAVGIILCALGVVAVYVGQSYEELKHRPNVIISERTEEKD